MGYIDSFLINNPGQIVSCNDAYNLLLKVKRIKPRIQEIKVAVYEVKVAKMIKSVVPDVEDWQYNGTTKDFYLYKFHNRTHRDQAKTALHLAGFETEEKDFIS